MIFQKPTGILPPSKQTWGGGGLGYLSLTVTPVVYDTLSTTDFFSSENPGASTVYPINTTTIKQTAIYYKFDMGTTLFSMNNNLEKALKLQILEIMEKN